MIYARDALRPAALFDSRVITGGAAQDLGATDATHGRTAVHFAARFGRAAAGARAPLCNGAAGYLI